MGKFFAGFVTGVALCVAAAWAMISQTGPVLAVSVLGPAELAVGESATLEVVVANPHDAEVVLDSIDIDRSLLNGLSVERTDPPALFDQSLGPLDQHSWQFDVVVAPGTQTTVRFSVRAEAPGSWFGRVEGCNPQQDCTGTTITIEAAP